MGKHGGKPENLKPFKKGYDPRRNLDGAPKKVIPELDALLVKVAGGETIEESEIYAVLQAMLKKAKSGHIEAGKYLVDRIYGKPDEKIKSSNETIVRFEFGDSYPPDPSSETEGVPGQP